MPQTDTVYLLPGWKKMEEFVHPSEFEYYREWGMEMRFGYVESHPQVRSSYHTERYVNA